MAGKGSPPKLQEMFNYVYVVLPRKNEEQLIDAGTHLSYDIGTLTIKRYCKDSGVLHTIDSLMGDGKS